ncbi:MAG: DNA mismatch endonuclease Vsr [Hyphomicrobiales bacterium]|nr:DNA mismatch endonuclease Vsr [Hyphomicrobiales bacterium]
MADVVDDATRSRMMAGIRSRNTRPELAVRHALHAMGFRYRLHMRELPGKPDMAFPGRRAAVFVHGCFWHGHDCPLFRAPSTRPEFWRVKIDRNRARDATVRKQLAEAGWRALTIWECALKGRDRLEPGQVMAEAAAWLRSGTGFSEIRGGRHGIG